MKTHLLTNQIARTIQIIYDTAWNMIIRVICSESTYSTYALIKYNVRT